MTTKVDWERIAFLKSSDRDLRLCCEVRCLPRSSPRYSLMFGVVDIHEDKPPDSLFPHVPLRDGSQFVPGSGGELRASIIEQVTALVLEASTVVAADRVRRLGEQIEIRP